MVTSGCSRAPERKSEQRLMSIPTAPLQTE
jgi:hypothetical protein